MKKKFFLYIGMTLCLSTMLGGCGGCNHNELPRLTGLPTISLTKTPSVAPSLGVDEEATPLPTQAETETNTPTQAPSSDVGTEAVTTMPNPTKAGEQTVPLLPTKSPLPPTQGVVEPDNPQVRNTPTPLPSGFVPTYAPGITATPGGNISPQPTLPARPTPVVIPTPSRPSPTTRPQTKPTATPFPKVETTPVAANSVKKGDTVYFGIYQNADVDHLASTIKRAVYSDAGYANISQNKYFRLPITKMVQMVLKTEAFSDLYDLPYGRQYMEALNYIRTFPEWETCDYRYFVCEPIAWEVLEVKNGEALLVSKAALDLVPYHPVANQDPFDMGSPSIDITWEKSYLRNWLSTDFYENAFSAWEKEHILWQNAEEKVTILDKKEAEAAFGNLSLPNEKASLFCNLYTRTFSLEETPNGWWLRNDTENSSYADTILGRGEYKSAGTKINTYLYVRPCIRVKLGDGILSKEK